MTVKVVKFQEWCNCKDEVINGHELRILLLLEKKQRKACNLVAAIVPNHYAFLERISTIFGNLGKEKAAAYLREKLPQTPKIRSGDLGEILATQYIDEQTAYKAPIKRLRWKDHCEMPLRGDDIIGIALPDGETPIRFLKSEAKSRASLSTKVVQEARATLNGGGGLPSPHALAFISDRLHEAGQNELTDLITMALLRQGISEKQVQHLFFTVCGNPPGTFLKTDLLGYSGSIRQISVGLRVPKHKEFIAAVYKGCQVSHES